jgi:anti-sigma factor RsiW
MTNNGVDRIPDEQLVAYLDGELMPEEHTSLAGHIAQDPDLQQRLLLLSGGNRPFRQAFEPLLEQAPRARLEAMLSSLRTAPSPQARRELTWKAVGAIAAAIVLFAAGLAADRLFPTLTSPFRDLPFAADQVQDDDDWRQAVAEYLTLYSSDTLASIPDDPNLRQRELEILGNKLALDLSPQQVALPGLLLKRAQLFEYEGKSLGQVAYLDPASGPVALCLITSGGGNSPQQVEQRQGFNVVYWTQGAHDFMLIGRAPTPHLQEFARELSGRLPG